MFKSFTKFRNRSKIKRDYTKSFEKEMELLGYTDWYLEKDDINNIFSNWRIELFVSNKNKKNKIIREVKSLKDIVNNDQTDPIEKELTMSILKNYYVENKWLVNDDLEEIPYSKEELRFKDFSERYSKFYNEKASL